MQIQYFIVMSVDRMNSAHRFDHQSVHIL